MYNKNLHKKAVTFMDAIPVCLSMSHYKFLTQHELCVFYLSYVNFVYFI